MRKIATLTLASAMALAALAPAAFAKPANCEGKAFAESMKIVAHDKDVKGQMKNFTASLTCVAPETIEEPTTTSTTKCTAMFDC